MRIYLSESTKLYIFISWEKNVLLEKPDLRVFSTFSNMYDNNVRVINPSLMFDRIFKSLLEIFWNIHIFLYWLQRGHPNH